MTGGRCPASLQRSCWRAHRLPLAVIVLLGLLSAYGCGSGGEARRHVVEMTAFAFRPDTLRIAAGDTVVWVNRDMVPHTATEREGAWDSGQLEANGSWTLVADERGESSYVCTLHPSMTGAIVVR